MESLVKLPMETYEIRIPKWMVWAFPIGFAIAFAIFYNTFTYLFHAPTCRDFHTRQDAQRAFNSNPIKYKNLDSNHNDIACDGI